MWNASEDLSEGLHSSSPPLPLFPSSFACTCPPPPPPTSLSVSQTAVEKRVEVNRLSPRLVNNVTQRLAEWVWVAAAGIKCLEYFLNYRRRRCPLPLQLDLCNLGDKFLSDLVPCSCSARCCSGECFSFFSRVTAGILAEQGSVFLSKSHVIELPSTWVSQTRACVWALRRLLLLLLLQAISMQRDYTVAHRCTSALYIRVKQLHVHARAHVLTFRACTHELVCKCLCSLMPRGAHAPLGIWALQSTASCYSEGPRRALLLP